MQIFNLRLPDDLEEFIRADNQLEYDFLRAEPGRIALHALADLNFADFGVQTWGKAQRAKDPNCKLNGHYKVPSVNLVAACEGHTPAGILLWVPDENSFGSWDCDHKDIWLFRGVTWSQIAANPLLYINGQWYPESVELEWLVPWPRYPFTEVPEPQFTSRQTKPTPSDSSSQMSLFPE